MRLLPIIDYPFVKNLTLSNSLLIELLEINLFLRSNSTKLSIKKFSKKNIVRKEETSVRFLTKYISRYNNTSRKGQADKIQNRI